MSKQELRAFVSAEYQADGITPDCCDLEKDGRNPRHPPVAAKHGTAAEQPAPLGGGMRLEDDGRHDAENGCGGADLWGLGGEGQGEAEAAQAEAQKRCSLHPVLLSGAENFLLSSMDALDVRREAVLPVLKYLLLGLRGARGGSGS